MDDKVFASVMADMSLLRMFHGHPDRKMLLVRLNALFDAIRPEVLESPLMCEMGRIANLVRASKLTDDQRKQLLGEVVRLFTELMGDGT